MLKNNQPEFTGIYTLLGFEHTMDIKAADVILFGVPFEIEESGRPGCRLAPEAIRRYSSCKPSHEEVDFDILEGFRAVDYGDFQLSGCCGEENMEQISQELSSLLKRTVGITIGVGGDYTIIYGELAALKERYGKMALIYFSPRTDTWSCKHTAGQIGKHHGAHYGTPLQLAIGQECISGPHCIQLGMRGGWADAHGLDWAFAHDIEVIEANGLHDMGIEAAAGRIRDKAGNMPVFISFDMGFLDPAFAPGAASPAVGGFSMAAALKLLRLCLPGLNIAGMDLVGVSPLYDPAETTCVAARAILREFAAILSYNKKNFHA